MNYKNLLLILTKYKRKDQLDFEVQKDLESVKIIIRSPVVDLVFIKTFSFSKIDKEILSFLSDEFITFSSLELSAIPEELLLNPRVYKFLYDQYLIDLIFIYDVLDQVWSDLRDELG